MRYLVLLGGAVVILCGAQARADEQVPEDFRFGIGVGSTFPADITIPNLTLASFRYKDMEFQPFVVISSAEADEKIDDGIVVSHDDASEDTKAVGTTFKYTFSRRRNVDLQFIGSLTYSDSTLMADPDGPSNRLKENTKELTLGYGLGIQWWFASNFSIMATATNPIFAKSSTTIHAQVVGGTEVTKSNERAFGLVWDPEISIALITWF
jgi:hypothetical protein